jgi:hypothetical protein
MSIAISVRVAQIPHCHLLRVLAKCCRSFDEMAGPLQHYRLSPESEFLKRRRVWQSPKRGPGQTRRRHAVSPVGSRHSATACHPTAGNDYHSGCASPAEADRCSHAGSSVASCQPTTP